MIKNSIKYGGILFGVAVVCSFIVALVYVIVDPIILERTAQKVKDNLQSIFSDPDFTYNDVTETFHISDTSAIESLYEVTLKDGSINYVYQMNPKGRNANILFLIAYDTEGNVLKIQYVQMRETKGRGDKITKEMYLDQIYKQNAKSMNVGLITGATISSTAMKQSIEATSSHLETEVLQ